MARLRRESSRSYSGRPVLSGTAVTPGTAIREGRCGSTGVSRGHSTGSHEPVNTPDGLTTREGLNLAGRTRPSVVLSRSVEADWPSSGQRSPWQRKSAAPSARTVRGVSLSSGSGWPARDCAGSSVRAAVSPRWRAGGRRRRGRRGRSGCRGVRHRCWGRQCRGSPARP